MPYNITRSTGCGNFPVSTSNFVRGATRILIHSGTDSLKHAYGYYDEYDYHNASKWNDIVEPITFQRKHGWEDVGASKSGFAIETNSYETFIKVSVCGESVSLGDFSQGKYKSDKFDLAFLQQYDGNKINTLIANKCYLWKVSLPPILKPQVTYPFEFKVNGELRYIREA